MLGFSALVVVACGGGDGGGEHAEPRPEQPAEVVYEQMKLQGGKVATWEGHPYTGLARGSHSDGSLRAEIPFKDGLRHGTVREYYENGQLSMQADYDEGQRDGERRYFNEEGKLTKLQQWRDDEVVESLEGDDLPEDVP